MYAKVTPIWFPHLCKEVVGAVEGLVPALRDRPGYKGLNVLTDTVIGKGPIVAK